MKTIYIAQLILLSVLVSSCKTNKNTTAQDTMDTSKLQQEASWTGTYSGILPCASCPGISISITLEKGNTYEKTVAYLESKDTPNSTKGTFTWDESHTILTIEDNQYKVKERQLIVLNKDGEQVSGVLAEHYSLHKK